MIIQAISLHRIIEKHGGGTEEVPNPESYPTLLLQEKKIGEGGMDEVLNRVLPVDGS